MKKRENLLREAWARLLQAQSFVLTCHQRPDGDALGSALALARVLRQHGKEVLVVSEDGVPDNYRFIPESETIVTSTDRRDFDVGMLVDCEGLKRAGSAADAIASGKVSACVDHHIPDNGFGQVRVVDQHASSTAELIVEFFETNEVTIDQVVATQLMTGLVNDTGAFRFPNTTPRTFRIAARLTELGAEASDITRRVYENRSLAAMKLLGKALASLETDADARVVWAMVTRRDMDELGASDADTDSVVNVVSWVAGAQVAILLREEKPDSIRVSLRSRDGVDVNRIARVFGGGGHAAAAGCTIDSSLEDARQSVVSEVLKWMEL